MLFLVVSTPHPSPPSESAGKRIAWREWAATLQERGEVREWYFRVGRGAAVIFDVPDNETLHTRLTEWLAFIPAHFDVYPLVDPAAQARLLQRLSKSGDQTLTGSNT
jgi:muconolactone delta-isomerase